MSTYLWADEKDEAAADVDIVLAFELKIPSKPEGHSG